MNSKEKDEHIIFKIKENIGYYSWVPEMARTKFNLEAGDDIEIIIVDGGWLIKPKKKLIHNKRNRRRHYFWNRRTLKRRE